MAVLKSKFSLIAYILFISLATAGTTFSQPTIGGGAQSQTAQNSQSASGGGQNQQGGAGGQMQQGPGGQQGAGFGQGQQSEQMQTMINQRLKQLMGSTDDEWAVIGPKVLKIYSLMSSQSRGLQMRSLMGNGNQGNTQTRGGGNKTSSSTGEKSLEELQTLLASDTTTAIQLKNKVSDIRKEKEKAKQELAKAQKDLCELLTAKQEAILISVGLLE
jgi:hypothetical protein